MAWTTAQQHREYRAAHKAAGLCVECTRSTTDGKSLCDYHIQKQRAWQAAHRPPPKPRVYKPKPERKPRVKKIKAAGECNTCPNPAKPDRGQCTECLAKAVENNRKRRLRFLAEGKCGLCGGEQVAERTMCTKHLEQIRLRAIVRNKERTAAGVCRQCSRPSEFGQVLCLIHRKVKTEHGLPQPVRHALTEYRKQQEQAAKDAAAKVQRGFIERHLFLISNPRTQEILRLRYGATEADCRTLEEIGERFGITRERVRQVQQYAEERIRMYTIEKDIPIPHGRNSTKAAEMRDTLLAMEVGDSFLLLSAAAGSRQPLLSALAKTLGYVVTTRKVSDTERRVWLVSKNGTQDSNTPEAAQSSPTEQLGSLQP